MNYYEQCAQFLAECFGFQHGRTVAETWSRNAFAEGNMYKYWHWKFTAEYFGRWQ